MPPAPEGRIKYGVSTYSYTGDVNTTMTLEDVFADIADLGATGIEILGEGNLPNYPSPDAGLDRLLARAGAEVRPDAHQLRLLGRHHAVATTAT